MFDLNPLILPKNFKFKPFREAIEKNYQIKIHSRKTSRIAYFDTFDWRLYNSGMVLYQIGKHYHLRHLKNHQIMLDLVFQKRPEFVHELPKGEFKNILAPIINVRALLLKARTRIEEQHWNILNQDGKTVCRLKINKMYTNQRSNPRLVCSQIYIEGLRGYLTDKRFITKAVKTQVPKADKIDPYILLLQSIGIEPGDYSAKLDFILEPDMSSVEALQIILKFLLSVIRQNEAGIKKDIDSEFLHDFRVAIRRTRSAISQLQDIFPESIVQRFKKDFSYLGKLSNSLRDFDVYLLRESQYKKMVPKAMNADIDSLFQQLQRERQLAHQKFIKVIQTQRYKKIIYDWQAYLDKANLVEYETALCKIPIIETVKPIIYNQFEEVIAKGREIGQKTADKYLHKLRIACKKLRYLLEFFASLFPKEKIDILIKQLKLLQDNLGDFNDLSIQQSFLKSFLEQLTDNDLKLRDTCAAIGALIGKLNDKQEMVRREFSQQFDQFASEGNIKLAESLFTKV